MSSTSSGGGSSSCEEFNFDKFQAVLAASLVGFNPVLNVFRSENDTLSSCLRFQRAFHRSHWKDTTTATAARNSTDDSNSQHQNNDDEERVLTIELSFTFSLGTIEMRFGFLIKNADAKYLHRYSKPVLKTAIYELFESAGLPPQTDQEEILAKSLATVFKLTLRQDKVSFQDDRNAVTLQFYNSDLEIRMELVLELDSTQDSQLSPILAQALLESIPECTYHGNEAKETLGMHVNRWKARCTQLRSKANVSQSSSLQSSQQSTAAAASRSKRKAKTQGVRVRKVLR